VYVTNRAGSHLAVLRCRLVPAALIPPLAWEIPCAACVALKKKKKEKRKKKKAFSETLGDFSLLSASYKDFFFAPCNKRCTFLQHNLVSIDWLY